MSRSKTQKKKRTRRSTKRAPSRPTESARRRLLDAAFELFHDRGVSATSVDEILTRSETGKSQFYHYFGSKDGLIQAVVEDFQAKLVSGGLPGTRPLESIDDLEGWFDDFLGYQRDTGCARFCPMATIASGLLPEQEPIRALIADGFGRARGHLEALFAKLAEDGTLPADTDAIALADFCLTIMQGGLMLSRVRHDIAPFEHAVAHAMSHVR
ncbi:MAG: TetR/AcrR family transcriptional regulator, partial [Planctomycetes bacterium]|nr:TetR/AcrR family transcriptional regulator [Planctomycetota bacterium]